MRALLYTAGAYVLCAGGTAAFTTNSAARCGLPAVPPPPAMGARGTSGSNEGRCAGGVPLLRMGAEDAAEAITRADALGNSVHTVAATLEGAYEAPNASKPWAPPVGYTPRPGSATPTSDAAVSDMARAHKLAGAPAGESADHDAAVMARVSGILSSQGGGSAPEKNFFETGRGSDADIAAQYFADKKRFEEEAAIEAAKPKKTVMSPYPNLIQSNLTYNLLSDKKRVEEESDTASFSWAWLSLRKQSRPP